MLLEPNLETVLAEGKVFDDEDGLTEHALKKLRDAFPFNTDPSQVLIKIIALNRLYSARVRDKDQEDLARHIVKQNLDLIMEQGAQDAVRLIWDSPCSQQYYSFATKFCSWHNPEAYPIFDRNVVEALWAYRMRDDFAIFTKNDLYDYEKLIATENTFRAKYGLESLGFKALDKFLWRVGDGILKQRLGSI